MTYTRQVTRYHARITIQDGEVETDGPPIVVPSPHTFLGAEVRDAYINYDRTEAHLILLFLLDNAQPVFSRSTIIHMYRGLPDEEIRPAARYLGPVDFPGHRIYLFEESL